MAKKNNTTIYLILAFLIVGSSAWYFTKEEKTKSKTDLIKEGMRFATQTSEIHKIFLAPRSGKTTTFERKDDHWIVNGEHKANPNVMKNLLSTLGRTRVKFIPTQASVPNIVKEMSTIGIKVELYDKNDNKFKTFYVGGNTNDELGTHMIMEGSNQPYVTYIPEMQGSLRWRFTPTGDVWRDKAIFQEKPDNITSISIEYPEQKSHSFKLERLDNSFSIKPFYENQLNRGSEFNTNAVNSFLTGYRKVIAEAFENGNIRRDSVLSTEPFSIINLKTKEGMEKTVKFYPQDKEAVDNVTGEPLLVHRYFVDVNNEDFYLAQQRVIGKLFWGYNQFFE